MWYFETPCDLFQEKKCYVLFWVAALWRAFYSGRQKCNESEYRSRSVTYKVHIHSFFYHIGPVLHMTFNFRLGLLFQWKVTERSFFSGNIWSRNILKTPAEEKPKYIFFCWRINKKSCCKKGDVICDAGPFTGLLPTFSLNIQLSLFFHFQPPNLLSPDVWFLILF